MRHIERRLDKTSPIKLKLNIMLKKRITLWLMRSTLKSACKHRDNETNTIVKQAYSKLIESYQTTIMFLEAEIASKKQVVLI